MKLLQTIALLLAITLSAQALTCWVCENARNNGDCMRRGRAQTCQSNQQACQNEVRRGSYGMLITKRCKQALACNNNFIQNPRAAWFPSQCNTRAPSSVCRCCCDSDLCNRDSIECEPEARCNQLRAPANGSITCSNENAVGSVCKFACDQSKGFFLFPQESTQAVCTRNKTWNKPVPCCAATCPPFAVMDLALVLDSSSSIGISNWNKMKADIRTFIESFEFSSEFVRLSVVRYNDEVDTDTQILFNSYDDDETTLLRAYDRINFSGGPTRTGMAVEHVRDELFKEANGNRSKAQDVMIVFTDGVAADGNVLKAAAQELRDRGVKTYAVGITPVAPFPPLDQEQLENLAGSKDNVFLAENGFEDLPNLLRNEISNAVCENRCAV